jgi:hypothetical protein
MDIVFMNLENCWTAIQLIIFMCSSLFGKYDHIVISVLIKLVWMWRF